MGLVQSNDSLPPGLWLLLPVGWLQEIGVGSGCNVHSQVWDYFYHGESGFIWAPTKFYSGRLPFLTPTYSTKETLQGKPGDDVWFYWHIAKHQPALRVLCIGYKQFVSPCNLRNLLCDLTRAGIRVRLGLALELWLGSGLAHKSLWDFEVVQIDKLHTHVCGYH